MLTTATISRSAAISKINMLGRPLITTSSRMYSSVLSGPVQFKESAVHHPQTMPLTDTTVYTAQGKSFSISFHACQTTASLLPYSCRRPFCIYRLSAYTSLQ
ncbi:predicted protein [Lichtheimia corymbifera JMRC:FSU:9682]|uniref:Uncharacterized protein n=1 Tax=Lichtheimia corymbifera JMRC:FSU:9682 TaxID=1263082 RepID=A0A068S5T3_9FUNG|nr:predicted protein [Lichtheimia corymbifera JMRC:FSU:9682]